MGPPTLLQGEGARGPNRRSAWMGARTLSVGTGGRIAIVEGCDCEFPGAGGWPCRDFQAFRIALERARSWNLFEWDMTSCYRPLTPSFSTPSTILCMIFSTTFLWFPFGLSSRNLIIRQCETLWSQCTSTTRSSICSRVAFNLREIRLAVNKQEGPLLIVRQRVVEKI